MTVAAAVLLQPMYLTSRGFGPDWANHLWLLWVQGVAIDELHQPSLFLNAEPLGVFFPFYAMYGGTLYAIGGGISALSGNHPVVAYVGMWTLAVVMAYGALLWISLQAGLRGLRAHAAPVSYVFSAYFITNMYARGVLPELMATSALCLVIAAGLHLLQAPRVRLLPATAFVIAVVFWTGSHNITLVWGAVVLLGLMLVALIALPRHGRELELKRVMVIVLIGGLSVGVNAWFLAPDILYSSRTLISNIPGAHFDPAVQGVFGRLSLIFNPGRDGPAINETLYTQLPVFVVLWLLVTLPLAWRRGQTPLWRRLTIGLTVIFVILLVLMVAQTPWDCCVPDLLTYIQFAYRLESYAMLCISLLLIAALSGSGRNGPARPIPVALGAALAYGIWLGVWQIWTAPVTMADRKQVFASPHKVPATWNDPGSYRDGSTPAVAVAADRHVPLDPGAVRDERLRVTVTPPSGNRPFATTIATGTYFVDVTGIKPVGRTPGGFDTSTGFMVATANSDRQGHVTIEIKPRRAAAMVIGRWVSVLSILALGGLAVASLAASARHRRR